LKNLKCNEELISPIRRIKEISDHIADTKPCSELCYKNLLLCDDELINKAYKETMARKFPIIFELLFMKFIQMIKYNPCYVSKLIKQFVDKDKSFKLDCYEIYKYRILRCHVRPKFLDHFLKKWGGGHDLIYNFLILQ
jgi:hypothetical protein